MVSPHYQFRLRTSVAPAIDDLAARLGTSPGRLIRFLVERTVAEGGALLHEHDRALAEMRQFHRDLVIVLDRYLEENNDLERSRSFSEIRETLTDLARAIDAIRASTNATPSPRIDEIVRDYDAAKPSVKDPF